MSSGFIVFEVVCLLLNIMKNYGTWLVVLKVPNKCITAMQKLRGMTRLLKITHRPCCEQFHVATVYFLSNTIYQSHHNAEGIVHLLMLKNGLLLG